MRGLIEKVINEGSLPYPLTEPAVIPARTPHPFVDKTFLFSRPPIWFSFAQNPIRCFRKMSRNSPYAF